MHEEDYAEEEHGHNTANLGDDGEGVQVRRRLEREKSKQYITLSHHGLALMRMVHDG